VGAGEVPPDANSEVSIINTTLPVTGGGQNITFRLKNWKNYVGCVIPVVICPIQGPFSVQTERFDTTADTISVVTLTGHPLAGWRYWRVFQVGTNDLVIESGAVDTYAGGKLQHPLNYLGYYVAKGDQVKVWEDDLRYILRDLQANGDSTAVQGTKPQYNVVKGAWDPNPQVPSQSYILNNVCQATTCN
jgi:leucyl-tRNA synthetase